MRKVKTEYMRGRFGTVPSRVRAEAAKELVMQYGEDGDPGSDLKTNTVDLLADIMHMVAHEHGLNFWDCVLKAKQHFDIETKMEGGE